jgi:acid phosphatase class B
MARSGSQRERMTPDFIKDAAIIAAQQRAMEGRFKFLPHGCKLFEVEQGWESTVIRGDESAVVVETLLELESALQNSGKKIIFIPRGALMTEQDIEKICQRNAIVKTFFKEVGTS